MASDDLGVTADGWARVAAAHTAGSPILSKPCLAWPADKGATCALPECKAYRLLCPALACGKPGWTVNAATGECIAVLAPVLGDVENIGWMVFGVMVIVVLLLALTAGGVYTVMKRRQVARHGGLEDQYESFVDGTSDD